jgi:hypothetical protein
MRVSSNKILQKYDNPTSHYVVTLLLAQNLSDSNFPEAAVGVRKFELPVGYCSHSSNEFGGLWE